MRTIFSVYITGCYSHNNVLDSLKLRDMHETFKFLTLQALVTEDSENFTSSIVRF